jgi:hypothetical protein
MCGRYAITTAPEAILRLFRVPGPVPNFASHYNAAPGQDLPVIRLHPETGERALGTLRWGFIPYWSKDPKMAWKCINARGERVKTAPAFRDAYRRRRCLVPADALMESQRQDQTALRHCQTGSAVVRVRRPLGKLEGTGERAVAPHVHHPDHKAQRTGRAAPLRLLRVRRVSAHDRRPGLTFTSRRLESLYSQLCVAAFQV